jgi:hypothetical protein
MGAWPNSLMSDNHVSIFLLVEGGGSVRIHMATELNGYLQWSQHQYDLSGSAIHTQDYELEHGAILEVAELYRCYGMNGACTCINSRVAAPDVAIGCK